MMILNQGFVKDDKDAWHLPDQVTEDRILSSFGIVIF